MIATRFLIKQTRKFSNNSVGGNTLLDFQVSSCLKFKDRPLFGVRNPDGTYNWMSYAEFGKQIDQARTAFLSAGLKPGERIACISNNR